MYDFTLLCWQAVGTKDLVIDKDGILLDMSTLKCIFSNLYHVYTYNYLSEIAFYSDISLALPLEVLTTAFYFKCDTDFCELSKNNVANMFQNQPIANIIETTVFEKDCTGRTKSS